MGEKGKAEKTTKGRNDKKGKDVEPKIEKTLGAGPANKSREWLPESYTMYGYSVEVLAIQ